MTWLTWRLHRNEVIAGLLLFVGFLAVVGYGVRGVQESWQAVVSGGCTGSQMPADCTRLLTEHHQLQFDWNRLSALLHAIPIVIAAIVALPTLFELERGTVRLAWTQSVTRRSWIIWRLAFALVVTLVVSAVWAVAAAEWREHIFGTRSESFSLQAYALSPVVLIAYGVFALALVLAIGGTIRKAIPAIVLMALLFAGAQFLMATEIRERFAAPVEEISTERERNNESAYGWQIDWSWIDGEGARLTWDEVYEICPIRQSTTEEQRLSCMDENEIRSHVDYHPTERFMRFQITEAVLYLAVSAALLGYFAWRLLRRPA
ncbi:MAG: hypothetical protein IT335_01510 [Thermomicrobiales bacterium]|nr:hypothetical protein [Thermomicrobiales bacterium]